MATSLTQVLFANPLRPSRAKPACTVEISHRRPPGRNQPHQFFTVIMSGIVMYGCSVHGQGADRRVRTVGFEFATREAKEQFDAAVLKALDASE